MIQSWTSFEYSTLRTLVLRWPHLTNLTMNRYTHTHRRPCLQINITHKLSSVQTSVYRLSPIRRERLFTNLSPASTIFLLISIYYLFRNFLSLGLALSNHSSQTIINFPTQVFCEKVFVRRFISHWKLGHLFLIHLNFGNNVANRSTNIENSNGMDP